MLKMVSFRIILFFCVWTVGQAKWKLPEIQDEVKRTGFNVHVSLARDGKTDLTTTSLYVSFQTIGNISQQLPVIKYKECAVDKNDSAKWSISEGRTLGYFQQSYHHHVLLKSLNNDARYCYFVGVKASGLGYQWSRSPYFLKTRNTKSKTFEFLSYGDMGLGGFGEGTIRNIVNKTIVDRVSFVLHGGDIGYGDDQNVLFSKCGLSRLDNGPSAYEKVYDIFMSKIEPLASTVPYMVIPGNHERGCSILTDIGCPQSMRNFSAYRHRFRMPSIGDADSMFYSFDYRDVHIIGMNSESDYPGAPTTPETFIGGGAGGGFGNQTQWLELDLKRASSQRCRRGQAKNCYNWIIVYGHRPMYTSRRMIHDWPVGSQEVFRKFFEPIFHKHGVDVYIGAHVHNYERVGPILNYYKCTESEKLATQSGKVAHVYYNPLCTVHLTNGAAGNCEGIDPQGPVVSHVDSTVAKPGYALFKVFNATHLKWDYFSTSGNVAKLEESVWIIKTTNAVVREAGIEVMSIK